MSDQRASASAPPRSRIEPGAMLVIAVAIALVAIALSMRIAIAWLDIETVARKTLPDDAF